mmetsp:Transcript_19660/g.40681  ORF Transcript_19660/g.40681 Transcript_19660/m.40681 type:complete len:355 (+) Transcript_19660:56-1120(+)
MATRHEDRDAMPPSTGKKKAAKKSVRPGLAAHMHPPGGLRELVVEFKGPPPFQLCGRGDVVSECYRNWPQKVLHIPDIPHIVEDPPNPDFLKRCKDGWDNDGRRAAENCFVRRIQRGWRIIEVNRVPVTPEGVAAALEKVKDSGKYTITFDFTACQQQLDLTASQALPKAKAKPNPRWKCPKSFPLLHAGLEGHLYREPSRMGPERWKHPENVVGTRQWYQANNLSYKRGARDAGRGDWVHCGTGAVQGELKKKSVPRWPATKVKEIAKKSSSFTSKVSLFLSKDVQRSAESLLSLSGSQSLPSIVLGQVPYPPTPAFVRDMMRRWCEEDAAREERERQEAEEAARLLEEFNTQ